MDGHNKGGGTDVSTKKQTSPPPQQQQQEQRRNVLQVLSAVLPYAAFLLLAVNSTLAAYRVRHSPWDLAFVVAADAFLGLLFWCLRKLETLAPEHPAAARERLKLAVWMLSTALSFMFAGRMSPLLPSSLRLLVWGLTLFLTVAGLCVLFVCELRGDDGLEEWSKVPHQEDA